MNLQEVTAQFLDYCQGKGLSDHTLRAYRQDLTHYQEWAAKKEDLDPFGKASITGWMLHQQKQGMAPASIRRRVACLKVLFRWLDEDLEDFVNPFHKLRATVQIPKRLPRNLKADELKKLLNPPDEPGPTVSRTDFPRLTLKLAIEILFTTGIRVGELCTITLPDINLPEETIAIKGKGNRERIVFLVDSEIATLLKNYIHLRKTTAPKTDHLLVTTTGSPAKPDYIRRHLHKLTKQTGLLRKITPHMLRHSAATQLIENGVDIRFVQKLLGHSSISTTEMYTHVTNSVLHQSVRRANPKKIFKKIM